MGKRKRPPKKPKLEIVFNESSRKEFLTGFRKRKNERRKRAKAELEEMVKAERKRIRQEVKDGVNTYKKSYAPLPLEDDIIQQEENQEDENVTVKVIELTTREMAAKRNWLGENRESDSEEELDDNNQNDSSEEEIPGMSLVVKKKPRLEKATAETTQDIKLLKTKRELNRLTQKTTLKSIKKSKVFKLKEQLNRRENKKLAKRQKNKDIKQLKSQGRRIEKKPNFQKLNKVNGKNPHKRKK